MDDSEISKKWYEEVYEMTTRKRCGLTSDSFGVVASSGYGDSNGVFPVYVGRDAHGDIVVIEIRFIG